MQKKMIDFAVPQGTVLCPILFNIYVNAFFSVNIKGIVSSFADDTILVFEGIVKQIALLQLIKIKQNIFQFLVIKVGVSQFRYIEFSTNN